MAGQSEDGFIQRYVDFFGKFTELKVVKHQVVVSAKPLSGEIYFLRKGYIKSYSVSSDGRQFSTIIQKPGDVFPIGAIVFDNLPNHFYFETLTRCTIYKCPKVSFLAFIRSSMEDVWFLLERSIARYLGVTYRLEHMALGNARSRVANILLICATRFGYTTRANGTVIDVPLTHSEIASLTGLTRETVSIELKRLKDLKIIDKRYGKYTIRDLERLEKETAYDNPPDQVSAI